MASLIGPARAQQCLHGTETRLSFVWRRPGTVAITDHDSTAGWQQASLHPEPG
jgi:hypothetical protein